MLAVSGARYYLPVKQTGDQGVYWLLIPREGEDRMFAPKFNYTLRVKFEKDEFCERFTACYNGKSVKPAPRTLRVFGAQRCQRVVSYLSSMDDIPTMVKYHRGDVLIFED